MKHAKPFNLNQKGFAHYIVPLVAVVLFVVIGVGYMVGSHADSVNPKAPTRSIISIKRAYIRTNEIEVDSVLLDSNKRNITVDQCYGTFMVKVYLNTKLEWSNKDQALGVVDYGPGTPKQCSSIAYSAAHKFALNTKYTIKVSYNGNQWFKPTSHMPIYRVTTPAKNDFSHKNTISGGGVY